MRTLYDACWKTYESETTCWWNTHLLTRTNAQAISPTALERITELIAGCAAAHSTRGKVSISIKWAR